MKKEKQCCGSCCWFKYEDTDGNGMCVSRYNEYLSNPRHCSDGACKGYVSVEEMRHHVAVLIQANRWRRDQNVPSIYRMVNQKEFGRAIDFAIDYIKTFMEL